MSYSHPSHKQRIAVDYEELDIDEGLPKQHTDLNHVKLPILLYYMNLVSTNRPNASET